MSDTSLQTDVERLVASAEPDVEVLLVEVVGPEAARIVVDHPQGVTLALCERVTNALGAIRERYALEVSSPGAERPLAKPEHFRRFLGRRARVRTRQPLDGRRTFTGQLVGAGEDEVLVATEGGLVAIAYDEIHRSNLVEE